MDSVKVRGPPQVVGKIDKKVVLHDPLLVTVLDFDRRALDQLAHGLHLTVTYTHNKVNRKKRFFKHFQKHVNPSKSKGGKDVFSLLKNICHNLNTYSKFLKEDKKEIRKTVQFLQKNIRNAMAHQTYLNCDESSNDASCDLTKTKTTEKCLDECAKLLQWVVKANFYEDIRQKVDIFLTNIENMKKVFEDFKDVKQSMKDKEASCDDTEKAEDILRNLLSVLEKEKSQKALDEDEKKDEEKQIRYRPITRYINMVMASRLPGLSNAAELNEF